MINNLIIEMVADDLALKIGRSADEVRQKGLSANDFTPNCTVEIEFEDGSTVKFKYAFFVENTEEQIIAVFTEHCGYHVFNSLGTKVLVEKCTFKTGRDNNEHDYPDDSR